MIGHVVPWCLSCGLMEHDDELFDVHGDPLPSSVTGPPDRFVEESLKMAVMGVE